MITIFKGVDNKLDLGLLNPESINGGIIVDRVTHKCKYCNRDISITPNHGMQQIIDTIAAYECTGLTPERCAELAKAEQEGRLKELPCKVGSLVYEPNIGRRYVSTYEIKEIGIGKNGIEFLYWTLIDGIYSNLNGTESCNIGKTVFLTLKEAEKALESEGKP